MKSEILWWGMVSAWFALILVVASMHVLSERLDEHVQQGPRCGDKKEQVTEGSGLEDSYDQ